eukprot:3675753-Prymnesium_polylepis.1
MGIPWCSVAAVEGEVVGVATLAVLLVLLRHRALCHVCENGLELCLPHSRTSAFIWVRLGRGGVNGVPPLKAEWHL